MEFTQKEELGPTRMEVTAALQERGVFPTCKYEINKSEDLLTSVKNSDSFQDYELACSSLKSYMKLHRLVSLSKAFLSGKKKKKTLIL